MKVILATLWPMTFSDLVFDPGGTITATTHEGDKNFGRALNHFPHDYWKPSGNTGDLILYRKSGNLYVHGFGMIFANQDAGGFQSGMAASLYYSDNGSSWTSYIVSNIGSVIASLDTPLWMANDSVPTIAIHKYWKISISGINPGTQPKIGGLFLTYELAISVDELIPETFADEFRNYSKTMLSGNKFTRRTSATPIRERVLRFHFENAQDQTNIESAFKLNRGSGMPLIIRPAGDRTQARFVRTADRLRRIESVNGVNKYELKTVDIPFLTTGVEI